MLNVNVPALAADRIKGVRAAKQAASRFIEEFVPEKEIGKKKIYTLAGEIEIHDPDGTSDEETVAEGYISLTPLKLDLTAYGVMTVFEKWLRESGCE
jgi:5'-nucleotidase